MRRVTDNKAGKANQYSRGDGARLCHITYCRVRASLGFAEQSDPATTRQGPRSGDFGGIRKDKSASYCADSDFRIFGGVRRVRSRGWWLDSAVK